MSMWYMRDDELYHHGIKGMRWGIRRYQDENGDLTEEGKKRYARAKAENARKKKENRLSEEDLRDPEEWVREDIGYANDVVRGAREVVNLGKEIEKASRPAKQYKKVDSSSLSDAELRARINRLNMEKQYSDLMQEPEKISNGRKIAKDILEYTGAVLGIASASLGIALAVRKLKNND